MTQATPSFASGASAAAPRRVLLAATGFILACTAWTWAAGLLAWRGTPDIYPFNWFVFPTAPGSHATHPVAKAEYLFVAPVFVTVLALSALAALVPDAVERWMHVRPPLDRVSLAKGAALALVIAAGQSWFAHRAVLAAVLAQAAG